MWASQSFHPPRRLRRREDKAGPRHNFAGGLLASALETERAAPKRIGAALSKVGKKSHCEKGPKGRVLTP